MYPKSPCPVSFQEGASANTCVSTSLSGIVTYRFVIQFKRPPYQERVVREYLQALPKGTYKGLFNPCVIYFLLVT